MAQQECIDYLNGKARHAEKNIHYFALYGLLFDNDLTQEIVKTGCMNPFEINTLYVANSLILDLYPDYHENSIVQ